MQHVVKQFVSLVENCGLETPYIARHSTRLRSTIISLAAPSIMEANLQSNSVSVVRDETGLTDDPYSFALGIGDRVDDECCLQ